jgi:uncharacterized protein
MRIDLRDLFNNEKDKKHIDILLPNKSFMMSHETIIIKDGIHVLMNVTMASQKRLILDGVISTVLELSCDRCNKDIDYKMTIDFSKEINKNEANEAELDEEDIYESIFESKFIDLEKFVLEEIYLNYPMKVLCSSGCKGICKQCGANLNDTSCGCEDDNIDPRLIGLKTLFDENFKEV